MRKEIKSITIKGQTIGFRSAKLYVGRNNGITYILSLLDPENLPNFLQNENIDIVTTEGETKTITGSLDFSSKDKAIFYIAGEPFPITPAELNKYY